MSDSVVATNKKAFRDFHLLEKWECGIALTGGEVKSIRQGEVNFADAFARVVGEEVFLYNLHINPYLQASYLNQEPVRERKLLLHKREILKIQGKASQKHLTLVPTKVYFNKRGLVKVELALGQGKQLHDKREDIKRRDLERELKRSFSAKRR